MNQLDWKKLSDFLFTKSEALERDMPKSRYPTPDEKRIMAASAASAIVLSSLARGIQLALVETPSGPTGAWAGNAGKVTVRRDEGD